MLIEEELEGAFERMAAVVDDQNVGDPLYQPMAGHLDTSAAYKAALGLVLKSLEQPSGYTEPLLHAWRLNVKATASLTPAIKLIAACAGVYWARGLFDAKKSPTGAFLFGANLK